MNRDTDQRDQRHRQYRHGGQHRGSVDLDQASFHYLGRRAADANLVISAVTATTISFSAGEEAPPAWPPVGTAIQIWPGPRGYQEKRPGRSGNALDLKANYDVSNQVEPAADQALGTDTLPGSLYLTAAPSWFGTLAWPAVNAQSPYTSNIVSGATGSTGLPLGFESIPAGYRYVHGQDPPITPTAPVTPVAPTTPAAPGSTTTNNGVPTFVTLPAPVINGFTLAPRVRRQSPTAAGVAFSALAPGASSYQWILNGSTTIPGAIITTDSVLLITGATSADAGTYTCVASNSSGSVTSNPATLTVVTTSTPGYLLNMSLQANVGTGANILIAGFGIGGSGTENLLLRGGGPSLTTDFGLTGTLSNPQLTLCDNSSTPIVTDIGWGNSPHPGHLIGQCQPESCHGGAHGQRRRLPLALRFR